MRYRVLSLDLHDTAVWDTQAIVEAQYEVRWSLLAQGLRTSNGSQVSSVELRRAREALHSEWRREARPVESNPWPLRSTGYVIASALTTPALSRRSSSATPKGD